MAGGSKLCSVLMFRHMAILTEMAAIGKGSHKGLWQARRPRVLPGSAKRLVEIRLEILDILKPNGEADAAVENAEFRAHLR